MQNEASSIATKYVDTYTSFSGTDMVCIFELPLSDGNAVTGVVGSVKTISYSVHNEKMPVRVLGNMNAIAYVYNNRTIAGSLVFQVFDKHWVLTLLEKWLEKEGKSKIHALTDELPPINITIAMANEYGDKARLAIYGVTFVNEGQVMSIEDFYTENTYEYFALDIDYLNQEKTVTGKKSKTTEDTKTLIKVPRDIDVPFKVVSNADDENKKNNDEDLMKKSLDELSWDKDKKKGSWWNLKAKRIAGITAGLAGLIALIRRRGGKKSPQENTNKIEQEHKVEEQEKPDQVQQKQEKEKITPNPNNNIWWQQEKTQDKKTQKKIKIEENQYRKQTLEINKKISESKYLEAYNAYIRAGKFNDKNFQRVLDDCCKIKWGSFKIATPKEREDTKKEILDWIENKINENKKIKNKKILTDEYLTKQTSVTNTENVLLKEDIKENIERKEITFIPLSKQIPVNYPNVYKYAIKESILSLLENNIIKKDKALNLLSTQKNNINSYMIDAVNDMRSLIHKKNTINTLYPITFLKQLENGIVLKNNEFKNGYNKINYYIASKPEEIYSKKTESDTIEITDILNPGLYVFYAEDENNNTTAECSVYIMLSTTLYFFEELKKYINDEKLSEELNIIYNNSANNFIKNTEYKTESLVFYYRNIKEKTDNEKKSFYHIINNAQKYENIQTINMNESLKDTSITYLKNKIVITPSFFTTHINVINKYEDKIISYQEINGDYCFKCKENTLYHINIYNNNDLIGKFIYYQFDNETTSKEYKKIYNFEEDINLFPVTNIDFTNEEKKNILYEKKYEIKNITVPRILAKDGITNGTVSIQIEDYNILQNLDRPIFLVGKEYDFIQDKTYNRAIPITSKNMLYNLYDNNLKGEIVFYIIDEKGNQLSNFTKYNLEENQYDYEHKKSLLEIEEYINNLLLSIKDFQSFNEMKHIITKELEEQKQIAFPSISKAFKNILNEIVHTNTIIVNKNKALYKVLNNYFNRFDYSYNLFENLNLKINRYNKSLDFPKGNNKYEIVQIGFNLGEDHFTTITYKAQKTHSIRLRYDDFDYSLFYCIDTSNYKKSGFVFFGNIKNDLFIGSNLYEIIEV